MNSTSHLTLAFVAASLLTAYAAATAETSPAGGKKLPAGVFDVEWNGLAAALRTDVAPGKFVEWCAELPAGERVAWRFDSPAPLNFNVHYHEGKDVHFPARIDAVKAANDVLQAPVKQDYCWMWTNKSGAPVPLDAQLRKEAR